MVDIKKLSNGLTVISEEIPHLKSVAYSLGMSGGLIYDEENSIGSSLILMELISRGAGNLNSKELSAAFESVGARHGEDAESEIVSLSGVALAEYLDKVIELTSLMVLQPHLPENEIDNIRSLFLQDIVALDDAPSRKAIYELRSRYFPIPYNRLPIGTVQGLKNTNIEIIKKDWSRFFRPERAILSVAGAVKTSEVVAIAEKYFGKWEGNSLSKPKSTVMPKGSYHHIDADSAQMQVTLMFPAAKILDEDRYTASVLAEILSGGMFGKLFIEVREKKGLCYSIHASYSGDDLFGAFFMYAGTVPERAQDTLDTALEVFKTLKDTITDEEIVMAKTEIKSGLLIGQESATAKAGRNLRDYWYLNRVCSNEEVLGEIEKVDREKLCQYIDKYQLENVSYVTLGKNSLTVK